jgi:Uma2 family endonuclease
MTAATLAPPDPATVTPPPRAVPAVEPDEPMYGGLDGMWRFSVADYHAMVKAGVLAEGERVELLNGLVVKQMPRGPIHDNAVYILTRRLDRAAPDGWVVRGQSGATLSDESEPEPDVLVARGGEQTFFARHPTPADAALVVEVADSSLHRDRREKLAIYAAAGVPEYWVVNVPQRQVEVYTRPANAFYDGLVVYGPGQDVPVTLDGTAVGTIPVADLFPSESA